ncbi:Dynein light chain 1, cytoplasmic [Chytriomyces hyalinus]|nr:Dynein light chain 1, cytoplasmic [Chytriomyces hyalinus]
MSDRKAVIKNADMSEEMQQDAVDCATQAMEKYNIEKDIAAFIKREFDKKYNPTWHCIVGRNFGSYVTHETKHFIYFYLGQIAILLFKVLIYPYYPSLIVWFFSQNLHANTVPRLPRNHKTTITRRILAVSAACIVSVYVTCRFLSRSPLDVLLVSSNTFEWVRGMAIGGGMCLVLFLGPIVDALVQRSNPWSVNLDEPLLFIRSIIAAPVSEEICFRCCMVPLWQAGGFSNWSIVFLLPLVFGLAHLHHIYDSFNERVGPGANLTAAVSAMFSKKSSKPGSSPTKPSDISSIHASILTKIVAQSCFQMMYTTVFGWFATYLLVQTHSSGAAIAAHVLCNGFGVPSLECFRAERRRSGGFGNWVVMGCHVTGLVGFVVLLQRI